tara:strand:- start:100 stop:264 length:165 start_codon:yes stop_codon:yes gene_type:complete
MGERKPYLGTEPESVVEKLLDIERAWEAALRRSTTTPKACLATIPKDLIYRLRE